MILNGRLRWTVVSEPHERRRREFIGGSGDIFPWEILKNLHSDGSMLQNQAPKSECKIRFFAVD